MSVVDALRMRMRRNLTTETSNMQQREIAQCTVHKHNYMVSIFHCWIPKFVRHIYHLAPVLSHAPLSISLWHDSEQLKTATSQRSLGRRAMRNWSNFFLTSNAPPLHMRTKMNDRVRVYCTLSLLDCAVNERFVAYTSIKQWQSLICHFRLAHQWEIVKSVRTFRLSLSRLRRHCCKKMYVLVIFAFLILIKTVCDVCAYLVVVCVSV